MKVIVYNQKGGSGKTMLATQIALHFDADIIEMDPYGMLGKTLEEGRAVSIGLNGTVPEILDGDVVYDFGGFDDIRLDTVAKTADLIIIPFNPTINALGTTLLSYKRAMEQNLPILFVVNAVLNDEDVKLSLEYLREETGGDIDFFVVPHTRALQTAENEGKSIIALGNETGLKKHTYKKISATMLELMQLIKTYL
jgi:chromosome partitioning protein